MVQFLTLDGDSDLIPDLDTEDVPKRVDMKIKAYVGKLGEEDWDYLEFEEEFETFERFTKRKGR